MKIKVGDKVKYIGRYDASKKDAICIYVGDVENSASTTEYVGIVPLIEKTQLWWINKEDIDKYLELVEVATYAPVPKFKIGDIVWWNYQKTLYKAIVVSDRNQRDFKYSVYQLEENNVKISIDSQVAGVCFVEENKLSKDKPQEEKPE